MRILKIESLKPVSQTWHDRDVIMLHACFQILKDFIEKEKGDEHCNYEAHKDFVDEIRFLYNWWKGRVEKSYEVLSDQQDEEDNKMLLRLLKVRLSLWT